MSNVRFESAPEQTGALGKRLMNANVVPLTALAQLM